MKAPIGMQFIVGNKFAGRLNYTTIVGVSVVVTDKFTGMHNISDQYWVNPIDKEKYGTQWHVAAEDLLPVGNNNAEVSSLLLKQD